MHFQIAKRIELHHNDIAMEIHHNDVAMEIHHNDIAMEIHHNDIAMEVHHNDITMEIHHNDIAMEVHHNDIAREWFCVYVTVRKTKTILRYFFSSYINTQDGSPSNLTPAISRVLTGRHLILCSPMWPTCCYSPRKCTPVKYKVRQKAELPIVT